MKNCLKIEQSANTVNLVMENDGHRLIKKHGEAFRSIKEVAEITGLERRTVSIILKRALKKMRANSPSLKDFL